MGIEAELPPAYLSGLAERWLEVIVAPHRKPSTWRKYESVIRVHLIPHFGDVLISSIHRRDVDTFIAHLHKINKSPNTINTILSALSGLMKTAVSWGYLKKNPCDGMVWGKPQVSEEFLWFNIEQTEVFLGAVRRLAPEMWRLFFLGFRTGLRPGELLAARQGDLDLVGGSIWVQRTATRDGVNLPKGNRKRRVALSRETVAEMKATRHLNGDLLCPTPAGAMWTHRAMTWRWERCLKGAGLPHCGPHTMRHSYASQLASAGVPLYAIQKLLGHNRPQETQRYAHLAPESQARWVQALDRPAQTTGHKQAVGHNLDTGMPALPNKDR
ncbi:MAG: integrase [Myxococcota bacterium]|jgi:integrase